MYCFKLFKSHLIQEVSKNYWRNAYDIDKSFKCAMYVKTDIITIQLHSIHLRFQFIWHSIYIQSKAPKNIKVNQGKPKIYQAKLKFSW